ncbi:MAG: TonB-dependent receptor [Proteobacteria bacterium]|nr:TonB-dependent receptor [Pseudomonadota bacterium]
MLDWTDSTTSDYLAYTSSAQSDAKLTWRAGMVYQFDFGLAPYFSYSTSFQPTIGVNAQSQPFKPTTAEQFELGFKFQPTGFKSFFMASLYQVTQQNVLTIDPGNVLFQVQTGEIRSKGIELSATLVPFDGLNIIAAYSYNDPVITRGNSNDIGHMPAFVPNNTASLWSDYTVHSGRLRGLQFGAGIRYVGFTYSDTTNTLQIPGYTLVDAMVGYDLGALSPKLEGTKVAVNAANLFNARYISECSSATNCVYGQGATVLATLRKMF